MDEVAVEQQYNTPFAGSPLLPLLLLSLASQRHSPRTADSFLPEYDYIVVGAGAAGSVVASRLSEEPCVNVLLIEAGKAPPRLTEVPAIARGFIMSDIDWDYRTEPQMHTGAGLINRQVTWPSGKALGGSTVINGMLHIRGNRRDYDRWARAGATGWSYYDVLPYFMKLEDNQDPGFLRNGYHGTDGPVTVHQPRYYSELGNAIDELIYEIGYKKVDPNGPRQTGFSDFQANLRDNQRCSTAKAYLVPAENRTNLHILSEAFAKKVIIEEQRAVGVQFDYKGAEYEIKAKKEVILSAGTVNTAKLLLLSGIGPEEELEEFGIPVVADLPVGFNFHDHVGSFRMYTLNDSVPRFDDKLTDPSNIETYINQRTGPLASTEGMANIAFLASQRYAPLGDLPFHEIYFLETSTMVFKYQLGIKPEVYEKVFAPYENSTIYTCISQSVHPRSRGYVALRSADPYDHPIIDPDYFHYPLDIIEVVEGMKACDIIATSEPLQEIGSKPFETLYPECDQYVDNEDLYLMCIARSVPITLSHPVGTAKMGNPADPSTVVDPKLRVKGVKGLRVVDASVMPFVPSGNTMVPTIMIGEKASDMIKETIECGEREQRNHGKKSVNFYKTLLQWK